MILYNVGIRLWQRGKNTFTGGSVVYRRTYLVITRPSSLKWYQDLGADYYTCSDWEVR